MLSITFTMDSPKTCGYATIPQYSNTSLFSLFNPILRYSINTERKTFFLKNKKECPSGSVFLKKIEFFSIDPNLMTIVKGIDQ